MHVLLCTIPPRSQTNPQWFCFREEAREPDSWSTLSHTVHAGEYCVKHHRRLDVYLLTAETKEGTKASLESDIRQLQLHMQSHQHRVRKHLWLLNRQGAGWLLLSQAAWHLVGCPHASTVWGHVYQ